jgi:signal transduction histidine kinase
MNVCSKMLPASLPMSVDFPPAAAPHPPVSAQARDLWVNARLVGILMEHVKASMLPTMLALPVLFALLWGHVNPWALVVWVGLAVAIKVYRYHMVGVYQERYQQLEDRQQVAFIERYRWTWTVAGTLTGSGVGLAFAQGDPMVQFLCALVLLSLGILSMANFSAYLPVALGFINALLVSVVLGLLLPVLLGKGPDVSVQQWLGGGFFLGVLWWLFRMGSFRVSLAHRASLELQYSNQELIDSLTEQTRALERAVTTKNRFLASAAHDLRQPVHALSLYAEWLKDEPAMAQDISPRILQSTRAINELFDSLFDLTRIDAGNYKVRLQHVDVQQLLAEVALQFDPVASAKDLQLRVHAKPTALWADPVMLRRILGNLVSNALRHTHQGGVLLALRRRGERLVFEVWDTGVGIAQEHQEAIFQEFFRVSQHQGTEDSLGLGLTIVSRLAQLMGYKLSLRSVPGKGSVFRVTTPAFTQQEPAATAAAD